jgi:hypothetical protein
VISREDDKKTLLQKFLRPSNDANCLSIAAAKWSGANLILWQPDPNKSFDYD